MSNFICDSISESVISHHRLMARYDLSFLKHRFDGARKFLSHDSFESLTEELKKYLSIVAAVSGRHPVVMNSPCVDALWNHLILHTRKYARFCDQCCGSFIHHSPNPPGFEPSPELTESFFKMYTACFGSPHQTWDRGPVDRSTRCDATGQDPCHGDGKPCCGA